MSLVSPDLHQVLKDYPTLTNFGFGRIDGLGKEMPEERFQASRNALLDHDEGFLNRVGNWIDAHCRSQNSPNLASGSYGLKHVIEQDLGDYVSNGVCIAAMVMAGYSPQVYPGPECPNCYFNVEIDHESYQE